MPVRKFTSRIYNRIVATRQALFVIQQAAYYIGAQVVAAQKHAVNNAKENKLFR